jgi:hypothetical protein
MKKADNFDAKKWLVENKVTTQSRLNEEEYSSERINQRDVEIAGGEVINHTFDTIDMIDLDNGYKVKVLSTYYFRDPGVKGYSDTTSEKNPMISGVKTTLMDPSGKPIKNHNFTGSGQWWMLTLGKKYFMPQIKAWWEEKMGKLGLEESRLNEDWLPHKDMSNEEYNESFKKFVISTLKQHEVIDEHIKIYLDEIFKMNDVKAYEGISEKNLYEDFLEYKNDQIEQDEDLYSYDF